MLVRLARLCHHCVAGPAWLIDYIVAVAFSARDSLRSRRASAVLDRWTTEALFVTPSAATNPAEEPMATRVLRPGRVAASLGLIGVLSVSVAGALWRESAPAVAPSATMAALPSQEHTQPKTMLTWAPLVPVDPLVTESTSALALAPTPAPTVAAEVAAAPVAAASAPETPTTPPVAAAAPSAPEPPPAATPEPTPVPAPAQGTQLTRAQIRVVASAAGWPEAELDELLSVAWCESRFRTDANGWGALGLMQIMPQWFDSLGIDVSWAFDPVTNLRVALHIHQNDLRNGYGEWASWTCKPAGLPDNAP